MSTDVKMDSPSNSKKQCSALFPHGWRFRLFIAPYEIPFLRHHREALRNRLPRHLVVQHIGTPMLSDDLEGPQAREATEESLELRPVDFAELASEIFRLAGETEIELDVLELAERSLDALGQESEERFPVETV